MTLKKNWLDNLCLLFYFIFREGKGGKEGEKHQCVVASLVPPTRGLVCNPGMCPDWESNRRPIGSQAGTQSTEPHQPGPIFASLIEKCTVLHLHITDFTRSYYFFRILFSLILAILHLRRVYIVLY